jgi:hypothetical protein
MTLHHYMAASHVNAYLHYIVTAVAGRRPRCSVVSVHFPFYFKMSPTNQKHNREAYRALVPQTKLTSHHKRREIGLPKYGSQSETMIDCP